MAARELSRVPGRGHHKLQRYGWSAEGEPGCASSLVIPEGTGGGLTVQPETEFIASHRRRWITKLMRFLTPPALSLPGEGPTTAADTRGLTADEVVRALHHFGPRTVFIVDDPNVAELRNAGVLYEFAPTTPEVPSNMRLSWIVQAYGVDRIVRIESATATT